MFKKTTYLLGLILLITSCSDTMDSVKRGLTGSKKLSTDEFLVQKKDPLILPPDFDKLPTPDDRTNAREEISNFEKSLEISTSSEDILPSDDSTEESILRQIRKQ